MTVPRVSVIIASHREPLIDACVAAILDSCAGTVPFEIIPVADYAIDAHRKRFPSLSWIYCPDRGIPHKRNCGISSARGEVCAFIDDDCRPERGWIAAACAFLDAHPESAGVEGMTVIAGAGGPGSGALREFRRLEKRGFRTNNIFYRTALLNAAGGFDERFMVQREDADLAYTILEAGGTIGYDPAIRVSHLFRAEERWDLLKNCVNRRFDPLLYKKHPVMYRRHIGIPYPPGILLLLCLYLVAAACGVAAPQVFAVALAAAGGVVVLLTVRRAGAPHGPAWLQWIREFISYSAAPVVILGALVHGSVRFRSVFLI
jgi:glycosyltransferase involved in cell wall biosynthesis